MVVKDRKITVVGLGNSGINAVRLLAEHGALVRATDAKDSPEIRKSLMPFEKDGIEIELGRHTKGFVGDSDLVVVSPGVEDSSPPVRWATELGIPVISEMELGSRFCRGRIIAITGTNGKSTVTTLIGDILKTAGFDTCVCGNIGNSLCGEIPRISSDTWVVMEASSFQLERITGFKPHIALILNITDDHLDRYVNFDGYFREKMKIFSNQSSDDLLVLNYDAPYLRDFKVSAKSRTFFYSRIERTNGAYVNGSDIFCIDEGVEKRICAISDIPLKGLHNLENVLASSLVGILAGAGTGSIQSAIKKFKGLAHRVETVDVINGVEYVDDSKGTTVDSTYRALQSSSKPVILIAGGRDKNSDYSRICDVVKEKIKYLILIGEAREKIKEALDGVVKAYDAETMDDAVRLASSLARAGWMVLLSPMCSSFDMFRDYKERGDRFKESVRALGATSRVKNNP